MPKLDAPSIAVDLPGRGRNPAPLAGVTPGIWTNCVLGLIERHDLRDVVLVGYSLGGMTALRVAARAPERLKRLVFIAAPIPEPGRSVADLAFEAHGHRPMEEIDAGLSIDVLRHILAPDLDEATLQWVARHNVPDARRPYMAPVDLTAAHGPVPRTYIRTALDHAMPPAFQDRSIVQVRADEVIPIESGHGVMLSRPQWLADTLNAYI